METIRIPKSKPRNSVVHVAYDRPGGPMNDRRRDRGGAKNSQHSYLEEWEEEQLDKAEVDNTFLLREPDLIK